MPEPLRFILNLGLRGGALISKFLLLLWMTRTIGLDAVGIYGLLQAAVIIGSKVIGAGLYFVANRDLVNAKPAHQAAMIRDQLLSFVPQYLLVAGLMALTWQFAATPSWPSLGIVMTLMLLNHLVVELFQILIALHRPVHANAVLFTNSGWAFVSIVLGILLPEFRTLEAVLDVWAVGAVCAAALSFWFLRDIPLIRAFKAPPDGAWLKQAMLRGLPLYLSVLGQQGGMFVDRYILQAFTPVELVGVFVMFWSFANAVQILVQTGVMQNLQPVLIKYHKLREETQFRATLHQLARQTLVTGGGLSLLATVLIFPVLHIINRPLANDYVMVFWIVLAGFMVRILADVFGVALYARHQDRAMWMSNCIGLIVAAAANLILIAQYGIWGAAFAHVLVAVVLLAVQYAFYKRRYGVGGTVSLVTPEPVQLP